MGEQIARRPDEIQISYEPSGSEFTVGLINNNQMNRPYNSLQIMRNFDITNSGSLVTRPGLKTTVDLNEFIEFDKLVGYRNSLTEVYKKSPTKKGFVTLSGTSYNSDGVYTLIGNSNNYDFIRLKVNNTLFTIDKSIDIDHVVCAVSANRYVVFSISGNEITIHEIHGTTTVKSVEGIASSTDYDKLVDDSTARGIIEVATVIQGKEVNMYTRYSKISLLNENILKLGNWSKAGLISVIDSDFLDNFYNNKRLFIINSNSDIYVKTPDGLFKLVYINNAGTVELTMVSLMTEVSDERYKPNTSEITVNGYNLLAEFPEKEIEDNAGGVINGLQGIIIQGVDVENRTQPFNVHKELLLRALVTYVRESDYNNMKFKYSYDYIGSQYTNNFSFNKKEGEFPISDGYGEQSVNFTPNKVGMYRIYCQMALPEDGSYTDSDFSTFHSFIDIQIELDNKTKNDVDEIYYYEAFKQSRIIRQWGDYYIVCGASQTTPYSSKIFISAPNNPSYFPTNYVQSLPSGTFVTDVVAYKGYLVILTNSGVYYISGDVPYSVAQLATDQSLKPFVIEKIVENISAYYTDNIVATTDGVIMVSDTIYKLFDTTSALNKIKIIGDSIIDMIPMSGFYFTQQIRDRTYFVKDDEILIYDTLEYNTYGVSGRFSFYHTHGLKVKDIFEELNQTFFVLETGQVCLLDKKSRGYDLDEPFIAEFKSNPNYFGNRNYPKKFKRMFYDIMPLSNEHNNHIRYVDYFDIKHDEEPADVEEQIAFSLNIFLDNEQVINSMSVEAYYLPGGDVRVERLHSPNMVVNNDLFQMDNKDQFVAYGKKEMYNIYGVDMVDWEQVNQTAYLAQVRLRGRGSHKSASTMMRFDSPVMINGLGYDFKSRSAKGDYVGNQLNKNRRVRR